MLNNLTLRTMSKFIMAMEGTPGWQERSTAKEYHATKLGRAAGDVFLTELMPLPCPGIHVWPYPSIFPTKADYHTQVRPGRIKWLRSEISKFHPDFVICYGKGNWPHYKEIFSDVEFTPKLNEQIHVGKREHSTIMLVRFLSPDLVSTTLIQEIADLWGQTPTD